MIPGYSYQLDNSEILNPSKHHIAAAPLALMESLQSLLPAVLPCKHQRCVVPTCSNIGRRKLWQIVAKTAAIIAMVLNFLSALWMLLSPRPSSESENKLAIPDKETSAHGTLSLPRFFSNFTPFLNSAERRVHLHIDVCIFKLESL